MIVDSEMRQAAAEFEELFPWVAVPLVLLDGVFHRLLGQAVLQLEGGHGQAVDEQAEVQGKLGLVAAVTELSGHAEPVLTVQDLGLLVLWRRRAVHQVELVRPVPDAIAQHVDGSSLRDLSLQTGQEPAARRAVQVEVQRFGNFGLRCSEEYG